MTPQPIESAIKPAKKQTLGRRSFLSSALLGAASVGAAALATRVPAARALPGTLPQGDVDILQFLYAAESLEADLWGQYSELATGNRAFARALRFIDPALPDYITGDFNDEASHAALIKKFLTDNGVTPVNLSPFQILPGSTATGSSRAKRFTNLSSLNVDTSYYNRYRTTANPDAPFNDTPAQVATIVNQPTIPDSDVDERDFRELFTIAQSAAFHFAMIEQGGSSLYTALMGKVSDPTVLAILASIQPTEVWHFSLFMSSLQGIYGFQSKNDNGDTITFPNIRKDPTRGEITPHPGKYFTNGYPLTSVIRPSSIPKAGAVATATALNNSGLFAGNPGLVTAAVGLATAADNATRNF